jgi:hypothetical protein
MLIYDPALDPYHTVVRILTLAKSASNIENELTIDAARIADYFLVYPAKMLAFRMPLEHRHIRTAAKMLENPYRHAAGMKTSFERMRSIFFAALSGVAAAGLIDIESLKRGVISLSATPIPVDLDAAIQRFEARQNSVGKFVLGYLITMNPNGQNGLKHRSSLIEHRYDIK